MPDTDLPPPERCLHNLHRAADRSSDPAEASDACRTDLGVVHMLDCPLFVGQRCAWFEEAPEPHPATPDADIAFAREELQRDFLGWSYRQRVRNLAKPRDLIPRRIALEAQLTAPEEELPLLLRVPVPAAEPPPGAEPGAPPAGGDAVAVAVAFVPVPPTDAVPAAAPPDAPSPAPAVEMYPGQRRSEDRGSKKARRVPRTPPQAYLTVPAPVTQGPDEIARGAADPAARRHDGNLGDDGDRPRDGAGIDDNGIDDDEIGDAGDDDFGDGLSVAERADYVVAAPPRPTTVEELLAILPEAVAPEGPPRERGQRPPGGGRPQHRRGRPDGQRRPGGPGAGQRGPGGPGGQRGHGGPRPPQGDRPPGGGRRGPGGGGGGRGPGPGPGPGGPRGPLEQRGPGSPGGQGGQGEGRRRRRRGGPGGRGPRDDGGGRDGGAPGGPPPAPPPS